MRQLASLVLALGLAQAAWALPIDDFSTVQSVVSAVGAPAAQTVSNGVASPTSIGGARTIVLARTAGIGLASIDVDVSQDDVLSFDTGSAVVANGRLLYDGNTDDVLDPTGLGGVDASDGGASAVLRVVARSDLAALLRVSFFTDASNFSVAEIALPGTGTDAPFQVIDVPFTAFVATGGGADFSSIGAVSVAFSGPASLDLQIDRIETIVPEPGTLLLLVAGLAGLRLLRSPRR